MNSLSDLSQNEEVEIIIVDNASIINEAEILQKEYPWIRCIRSEHNLGYSGGNNLGTEFAEGEYLLFVNNDILAGKDSVFNLLDVLKCNHDIAAISPCIQNVDGSYSYSGCEPLDDNLLRIHYITFENDKGGEVPLIHGAAVMMPKKVLLEVGDWPDIYFLYSEEVDLSLRFKRKGYKLWYEPTAKMIHIGSCSTGKNSPLVCYYNSRNRLLLYKRNLQGGKRIYSILYHLLLIVPHNCFLYMKKHQYDLLSAYLSGVKDFIGGRFGERKN